MSDGEQLTLDASPADPPESRLADRARNTNHDERLRGDIVAFIAAVVRAGHPGVSDDELQARVFVDESPGSVSKRRLDATRQGLLAPLTDPATHAPVRRRTRAGRLARCWTITDKGADVAWRWPGADPVRMLTVDAVAANDVLDRRDLACIDPGCSERLTSPLARLQHSRTVHGFQTLSVMSRAELARTGHTGPHSAAREHLTDPDNTDKPANPEQGGDHGPAPE